MGFDVLAVLLMKISVFSEMTRCRLVCSVKVSDELSASIFRVAKVTLGLKLATHLHLLPRLRLHEAISLLPRMPS
jgi:hypothetical protein